MPKREFITKEEYRYDHSNTYRWLLSHIFRYRYLAIGFPILSLVMNVFFSLIKVLIGDAFNIVQQNNFNMLISLSVQLIVVVAVGGITFLSATRFAAILGMRIARDARDELYLSLLGKSQTFHNRQRVGDIMARTSNDMDQLSNMILPGLYVIFEAFGSLLISLLFIAIINPLLLLSPLIYIILLLIILRFYQKQLHPVATQMRQKFGETNAVLNEAVVGIEVVKTTAQEEQEKQKFISNATMYRNYFVRNGLIQGCYFPTLIVGIFLIIAFLHGLYLFSLGYITLGSLVTFMALVDSLRYVTEVSSFGLNLIQSGIAGSKRILDIMHEESDIETDIVKKEGEIKGDIIFERVSFNYERTTVLKNLSFHIKAGQTVAIVGPTGTGKSTLTKLINRIYDVSEGSILIDGVNVRNWKVDSLRSQISTIEQDVFLFSRTIAENIAYGLGKNVDQSAIEVAAKNAQAHDFIMGFENGYDTIVGERGVTLSGQRQRIAIARALLTNPRILILDDATSAIDSATEDKIQKAMERVLQGRTAFLITHRLPLIRWADTILVLQEGELIDQGTHEDLLERCNIYRRMFSPYDSIIPIRTTKNG